MCSQRLSKDSFFDRLAHLQSEFDPAIDNLCDCRFAALDEVRVEASDLTGEVEELLTRLFPDYRREEPLEEALKRPEIDLHSAVSLSDAFWEGTITFSFEWQ